MINLVFIAPPAAGKGTQSELLKEKYNFSHISTGDILREVVSTDTPLGREVKDIIDKGILVGDELVFKLLKEKLLQLQDSNGIIFDGFPRTIVQAGMLDELLNSLGQTVNYVIYLDIDKDMAKRRALGRITCPNCNAIYNSYTYNENICEKCGSSLQRRDDDNEETFIKRFDTYIEKSKSIMDYYKEKGLLHIVKCAEEKEGTFEEIEKVLKESN